MEAGCLRATPPPAPPAPQDEGGLYVYLLPLPREASRLAFHLEELSAVREDGATRSLGLSHGRIRAEDLSRERRIASGRIPPGRYTGLSLRFGAASLLGEEGVSALISPKEPVTVPVEFALEPGRAVVLSIRLDSRASVEAGFRFAPALSASVPSRIAPDLLAIASSRGDDAVTLFDKVTGRIAGVVPTGREPAGIALDRERRRAYVAVSGEDAVEAVGLLEQSVLNRTRLRGGDEPRELALTPDGATLFSANAGSSSVSVLDALPLVETARIPVGDAPNSILVDRAGRRAYVFNSGSSSITVLDVAKRTAVATVATEAGPLRGALNRAGDALYVIHRASPYLTVIDPVTLAVTSRVYVGPGAVSLKVDPRTDRVYLARRNAKSIEIFDPPSLLAVDSIPAPGEVGYLTIDGEGNNLFLVLPDQNEVRTVGIVGKGTTARAEVGEQPCFVALMGER